jgi:DNA-binding transcriptional ArsR family regulator
MVNNRVDEILQSLADPTRRQIVERLTFAPMNVSEIAGPMTMSLPAVLKHLAILQRAGVVHTVKVGRVRTCRLVPEAIRDLETWVSVQRTTWETHLDALGDYLDRSVEPGGSSRKEHHE